MFDLFGKNIMTIAGDPLNQDGWYIGHLANTAHMINADIAQGIFERYQRDMMTANDVATQMRYQQTTHPLNNLDVKEITHRGETTGIALVANKDIPANTELFVDYGIMYGRFQLFPQTKALAEMTYEMRSALCQLD